MRPLTKSQRAIVRAEKSLENRALLPTALTKTSRVAHWVSTSGGFARCNVCGEKVATWDKHWARTKKADRAIAEHGGKHLADWDALVATASALLTNWQDPELKGQAEP